MIDQDLLTALQYALIEPPDGGASWLSGLWTRDESVSGPHAATAGNSATISPGVRFGWNLPGGLQVVPGVAVPIGVGPSRDERSLFLYLSFEHPFVHEK